MPQDRPGDDEVGQGPPRGNSWRPDGAFQKRRRGESVGLGLDQAHAVPGGMRAAGWVRRVLRGVDASNAQPTAARSVRDLLARRDPKAAAQRDFSSTCTNRRIARRIPAGPGSRIQVREYGRISAAPPRPLASRHDGRSPRRGTAVALVQPRRGSSQGSNSASRSRERRNPVRTDLGSNALVRSVNDASGSHRPGQSAASSRGVCRIDSRWRRA